MKPAYMTTDVDIATTWLKEGRLLAYPTESVWGLGCDAYNQQAVQSILSIKQRPIDKGLIVVTDSITRIFPLLATLSYAQKQRVLISWQTTLSTDKTTALQAITWLLPLAQDSEVTIPTWITGKHDSVAVRVIAHPLIQSLCEQMVSPHNPLGLVVSTSCNPASSPPASSFSEAHAYFGDQIHYLIGDTLGYTLPSQIREAITGNVIR